MKADLHTRIPEFPAREGRSSLSFEDRRYNRIYMRNLRSVTPHLDFLKDNNANTHMTYNTNSIEKVDTRSYEPQVILSPPVWESPQPILDVPPEPLGQVPTSNGVTGYGMNSPYALHANRVPCGTPSTVHHCNFYDCLDDSFGIFNPGFKEVPVSKDLNRIPKEQISEIPDNLLTPDTPDYLFLPIEAESIPPTISKSIEESQACSSGDKTFLNLTSSIPKSKSTDFGYYDYDNLQNELIFPYPKGLQKSVFCNDGAREAPFVLEMPKNRRKQPPKIPQCKSDQQIFSTRPALLRTSLDESTSCSENQGKYILPIPDGTESTISSSQSLSSRTGSVYSLSVSLANSKSSSMDHGVSPIDLRLDNFHQSEYVEFKNSQMSLDVPVSTGQMSNHPATRNPPLEKRSFSLPHTITLSRCKSPATKWDPNIAKPSSLSGTTYTSLEQVHKCHPSDEFSPPSVWSEQISEEDRQRKPSGDFPKYFTPLIISSDATSGPEDTVLIKRASSNLSLAAVEKSPLTGEKSDVAYGRKKTLAERRQMLKESRGDTGSSSGSFNSSFESPAGNPAGIKSRGSDSRAYDLKNHQSSLIIKRRMSNPNIQMHMKAHSNHESIEEEEAKEDDSAPEALSSANIRRLTFARTKSKKSIEPEEACGPSTPYASTSEMNKEFPAGMSTVGQYVRLDHKQRSRTSSDSSSSCCTSSSDSDGSSWSTSSSSSSDSSDIEDLLL